MKKIFLILAALSVGAYFYYGKTRHVEIPELPNFDMSKYLGKWYEIARLDHSFERGLEQVNAEYSLGKSGKILVVNKGYSPKKNAWQEAQAHAEGTSVKSHFKVYFVPLIGGQYQVAYINDDYTQAVVSGGTKDYLWFLSRTPVISEADKEKLCAIATKLGYNVSPLIYTKQSPATETAVAGQG